MAGAWARPSADNEMKTKIDIMKARLALALVAIALSGCRDTVTSRYETLAAARADGLFERGWLPDVLPPSSHDIIASNDLDLNISTGRFSLAPAESPNLYKRLSAGAPPQTMFADWSDTVIKYATQGYSAWSYHDAGYTWVFFCTARGDRCEYFMSQHMIRMDAKAYSSSAFLL